MKKLSDIRCIVLGGGGFIGTALCRALQGKVEHLRIFGRRLLYPHDLAQVDWFPGDFNDITTVASAIAGYDTVIHLINSTTPASANVDKIADLQSNVVPTLQLLEACRISGVKRIIFVSSGGTVYGITKKLPIAENAETSPITAYGISKLAIEKYLALYHYLHGIEYRVLRISNPYGPYQTANKNQGVISSFLQKILSNKVIEIWGDGSVVRDYIYIDDVVDAFIQAMIHEGNDYVFNIGSGTGRSLNDVINAIQALLNKTYPVKYLDKRAVDIPANILDISKAKEKLQWQPKISFEEGLQRTYEWNLKKSHYESTG